MLEEHFKKIFNVEESDLSESQIKIKDEVIRYERTINLQDEFFTDFNDTELELAIKESKNSKAIGLDEICPLWLKLSNSSTIRYFLLKLLNSIYKDGLFPDEFNSCKLRPIIKNFNKSNEDLNNVRPI